MTTVAASVNAGAYCLGVPAQALSALLSFGLISADANASWISGLESRCDGSWPYAVDGARTLSTTFYVFRHEGACQEPHADGASGLLEGAGSRCVLLYRSSLLAADVLRSPLPNTPPLLTVTTRAVRLRGGDQPVLLLRDRFPNGGARLGKWSRRRPQGVVKPDGSFRSRAELSIRRGQRGRCTGCQSRMFRDRAYSE